MRDIERREYQIKLYEIARNENSLIVLPTGLGKTVIMGYLIEDFVDRGKVIVVAPTRPLVNQLYRFFLRHLEKPDISKIVELTGEKPPEQRKLYYKHAKLIVATPQVIYNDVIKGILDLSEVSLLILDEAHHATGTHHYVRIAELYRLKNPKGRIVGFTASPGSSYEEVLEVAKNIGASRIVARDEEHPEVKPYVHERRLEIVRLEMDDTTKKLLKLVDDEIAERKKVLEEYGIKLERVNFRSVREVIDKIKRGEIVADTKALSAAYNLIRLSKLRELIETQGPPAVKAFLRGLEAKAKTSSAVRKLLKSPRIGYIKLLLPERKFPKLEKVVEITKDFLSKNPGSRVLIFANYKETTKAIAERLKKEGIKADRFTGRSELSQNVQVAKVSNFKAGLIDVLVSTSVGEEGIDVGEVDLVIFYDAVPSAIRRIQRMGRTGRRRAGKVVVLLIKGTKDESYFRLSRKRERQMKALLKLLEDVRLSVPKEDLEYYVDPEAPEVIVDDRESRTAVVHELIKRGIRVRVEHLDVGDYVIGDVVIERKSFNDFSQSIIDGRLFQQALSLKEAPKPLIIVEGEGAPRIGRRAFLGALLSLMLDYRIPIIFTKDPTETAEVIELIAKKTKKPHRIIKPKPRGEFASRVAFLSMLPGVNETLATRLLKKFKTIRRVIDATPGELMSVEGIGEKKAKRIREFVNKPPEEERRRFSI